MPYDREMFVLLQKGAFELVSQDCHHFLCQWYVLVHLLGEFVVRLLFRQVK